MKDKKNLIFCDSVKAAKRFVGRLPKDGKYLAMNPDVFAYLTEQGLDVSNTLPYFSTASHEQSLKKSDQLTCWLRDNLEFTDPGLNIGSAYRDIFVFWFRFMAHYCFWSAEIVCNAVEKLQPVSMTVVSQKRMISSLYLEPEEGSLSQFVRSVCKQRSIKFKDLSLKSKPADANNIKKLAKFLVTVVKAKIRLWLRRFNRPVVFATTSYQMDKLEKQAVDKDTCVLTNYFVPALRVPSLLFGKYRSVVSQQKHLTQELCSKIIQQKELFAYRGIEFGGIIAKKIGCDYIDLSLNLMLSSLLLDQELNKLKPAVVISNVSRFDDLIIAQLCRNKNIPNLLVSHGSHVKPKNEAEMIEWGEHGRQFLSAPFSHIAVPTPTSNEYFEAFPTQATTMKTKPMTWGVPVDKKAGRALFKQMFNSRYSPEKTKVVVHAGTPKASHSLRFYVYETADEYLQVLQDLAKAVEQLPDTVLIVKFRPLKEISVETIRRLVPFSDKVKLSVEESLLDVLAMADLLVSFSSTAVDEALQNKIPVLLYGGDGRYQHIPAHILKSGADVVPKAIYHLTGGKYLASVIEHIIVLHQNGATQDLFDQYIYADAETSTFADLVERSINK